MGSMRMAHRRLIGLPARDGDADGSEAAIDLLHGVNGRGRTAGHRPGQGNQEENDPGREKHVDR